MKKDYINEIVKVAIAFDKELNKPLLQLYTEALMEYPIEKIRGACAVSIKTLKFFPKIAEIIELIGLSNLQIEETAETQATKVLEQIRTAGYYGAPEFKDPITKHLMSGRFNFKGLCQSLTYTEEKWFVRNFVQSYRAFDRNKEYLLTETPEELKQITDNLFEGVE